MAITNVFLSNGCGCNWNSTAQDNEDAGTVKDYGPPSLDHGVAKDTSVDVSSVAGTTIPSDILDAGVSDVSPDAGIPQDQYVSPDLAQDVREDIAEPDLGPRPDPPEPPEADRIMDLSCRVQDGVGQTVIFDPENGIEQRIPFGCNEEEDQDYFYMICHDYPRGISDLFISPQLAGLAEGGITSRIHADGLVIPGHPNYALTLPGAFILVVGTSETESHVIEVTDVHVERRNNSATARIAYTIDSRRLDDSLSYPRSATSMDGVICMSFSRQNPDEEDPLINGAVACFTYHKGSGEIDYDSVVVHEMSGNSHSINKLPQPGLDGADRFAVLSTNPGIIDICELQRQDGLVINCEQDSIPLVLNDEHYLAIENPSLPVTDVGKIIAAVNEPEEALIIVDNETGEIEQREVQSIIGASGFANIAVALTEDGKAILFDTHPHGWLGPVVYHFREGLRPIPSTAYLSDRMFFAPYFRPWNLNDSGIAGLNVRAFVNE